MNPNVLEKLICPICSEGDQLVAHSFDETKADLISNGIVICKACHNWFSVDNHLLEFTTPDLQYKDDKKSFASKYATQLSALGVEHVAGQQDSDIEEQQKQRDHYDHFDESGKISYDDFENLPFWIANDKMVFEEWSKSQTNDKGWMLDVGCGNGRSAERLTADKLNVIGLDISKEMLKKAVSRALKNGKIEHQTFIIGDATNLPIKDASVDYAITSGVLSQLPDINKTCNEIYRALKPNGIYFGLENNKSMFRGIFDLLNKVVAIWKNEKGKEPEISHKMLANWFSFGNVSIKSLTSVFLPPGIFNKLGVDGAKKWIVRTNKFFYFFGLRNHGGLIIFETKKLA